MLQTLLPIKKYLTVEFLSISHLALPLAFIVGAVLLGILAEILVIPRLHKRRRTRAIGEALQGMTALSLTILGIYAAVHTMPIVPVALAFLKRTLHICMMLAGTIILARFGAGLISLWAAASEATLASVSIFSNVVRIIVYLAGGMVIFHTLGFSLTPALTAIGAGGLAVALGLQNTVASLFAGLHIIVSRKIRPGDYVKLDTGHEGYVVDMTWRDTMIKVLLDNVVIVPNSRLASAIVTNYSLPDKQHTVLTQVAVSYESDLEKVEEVTLEVAREVLRETRCGLDEFEPFVRYHTLGDWGVKFIIIMKVSEFVDQYEIRHEFIKRLTRKYRDEGIVIPFPTSTVHLQPA
ncbi:MAG: mechanosensitive ion channel family protein [Syntrophorhabdales bacterium]|jgi:small-conductance mechanosensitive channel